MKITFTGASGFIGRRLTARLLSEGHSLHVLGRRKSDAAVTFTPWDALRDSTFPAAALEGADAVFHLAGEPVAQRWTNEAKHRIRASRINGGNQLIEALTKLQHRPEVLISASAIGYYGDRGDEILTEASRPGDDFLALLCTDWERIAGSARSLGMRTVSTRLGVVLGREGGALAKMLPPFRLGVGGRIGSGRQWMSWIHVDDVIGLILFALHNRGINGPLNLTAPNPVRNSEFTKALGAALHRPTFLPVPAFALRLAFGEMASMLTGSQRVQPTVAQRAGYSFQFASLAPALDDVLR